MVAAILATFIKKERAELAMMIGIGTGVIIFYFILSQISVVIGFLQELLDMVAIEETYFTQLLKMLVAAEIPVNGFVREQGDLESIFMQITLIIQQKFYLL